VIFRQSKPAKGAFGFERVSRTTVKRTASSV
jgi:hypothetical protein